MRVEFRFREDGLLLSVLVGLIRPFDEDCDKFNAGTPSRISLRAAKPFRECSLGEMFRLSMETRR